MCSGKELAVNPSIMILARTGSEDIHPASPKFHMSSGHSCGPTHRIPHLFDRFGLQAARAGTESAGDAGCRSHSLAVTDPLRSSPRKCRQAVRCTPTDGSTCLVGP